MSNCTHHNARALCFECFRAGMERTRARREAYAQRALPFSDADGAPDGLTDEALRHRQRMLDYLEQTARRA